MARILVTEEIADGGLDRLRAEGNADQAEGKIQKKVGDIKKVFDK